MSLKEESTAWVLVIEHFSGTMTEVLGVFTDLEAAKEIQRSYDNLNRISVTIYRTSLFAEKKRRARNDSKSTATGTKKTRIVKEKANGDASDSN